jgi:hypothetical protein
MYAIGTYYALLQAMQAYRPELELPLSAPLTPERVLGALYPERLAELRQVGRTAPAESGPLPGRRVPVRKAAARRGDAGKTAARQTRTPKAGAPRVRGS